jgi:hypothetical protein
MNTPTQRSKNPARQRSKNTATQRSKNTTTPKIPQMQNVSKTVLQPYVMSQLLINFSYIICEKGAATCLYKDIEDHKH